jgi:hypothetical protein
MMVYVTQKNSSHRLLSAMVLIGGLMFAYQAVGMNGMSGMSGMINGQVIGNLMKSGGWYERYPNGQIVLYPAINPAINMVGSNMNSMSGMDNMSMSGMGMVAMTPMVDFAGMNAMHGMLGMGGMNSLYSMSGMMGSMAGMSGMYGMPAGMSSMLGMGGMYAMGMYGISPNYQMTFGKFKIDQGGNLVLYPFHNPFNLWDMENMNSMGQMGTP